MQCLACMAHVECLADVRHARQLGMYASFGSDLTGSKKQVNGVNGAKVQASGWKAGIASKTWALPVWYRYPEDVKPNNASL